MHYKTREAEERRLRGYIETLSSENPRKVQYKLQEIVGMWNKPDIARANGKRVIHIRIEPWPDAVRVVARYMEHPNPLIREFAAIAVCCSSPCIAEAYPGLKIGIKDMNPNIRFPCARAFAFMPPYPPARELLLTHLKDSRWSIRWACAAALSRQGYDVDPLDKVLRETFPWDINSLYWWVHAVETLPRRSNELIATIQEARDRLSKRPDSPAYELRLLDGLLGKDAD